MMKFKDWFHQKYGVPFPANKGDNGLYDVIIPRAMDAMAEYVELIGSEISSSRDGDKPSDLTPPPKPA